MWGFCGCNRRNEEIREERDEREFVTIRRSCSRKDNHDNNNRVSPSSFCERQLEAARNGCRANPLTNFSGCTRRM